jgi:polysaccharide export outer membrane protein
MKRSKFPLLMGLAALLLGGCATQPAHYASDPLANPSPATERAPAMAPVLVAGPAAAAPTTTAMAAAPASPAASSTPAWDALESRTPGPVAVYPPATTQLDPDLLQPPTDLFLLGPGDKVDVEIVGNPNSHATSTVGLDGKLYFSFLPGMDVWGLTLTQARSRIQDELSKYITQPTVSLTLDAVGSKFVWILGRVTKPGVYPVSGSMSLLEALTLAGGTATSASTFTTQDIGDLRHSFVMRPGKVIPVDFVRLIKDGDMSQNIYLKADDFVYIPSSLSQQIYVLGAVAQPQAIPYADGMSVIDAIAGTGGPIPNAYVSHVGIARGSIAHPELIVVDFKAIATGKTRDVPLEAGDIVYVPLTPYHVITDYATLIIKTFAGAWTANMGSRAVTGGSTLGVSVPVGSP